MPYKPYCLGYTRAIVNWMPYEPGYLEYTGQDGQPHQIAPEHNGELTYTKTVIPFKPGQNPETYYTVSCNNGHGAMVERSYIRGGISHVDCWRDEGNRQYWIQVFLLDGSLYSRGFAYGTQYDEPLYPVIVNSFTQQPETGSDQCEFKVFEGSLLRLSRTDNVCPDATIYPCKLNHFLPKPIETTIDKKIEELAIVEPFKYEVDNEGNVIKQRLPANQLNAYRFVPEEISETGKPQYILIQEMMSTCHDKPPIYQIDCTGEDCPIGTCKVECHDHYCCYDQSGRPIKDIPK